MKETQQDTIEGIAHVLDLTPERVEEGFRKATASELREIKDGAFAVATLFDVDSEIVSDERKANVMATMMLMDLQGRSAPATDFSALAAELEAAQQQAA